MGRRRQAQATTEDSTRQAMLRGITSDTAVLLYDEGMRILRERDEASFLTASKLRQCAQWSIAIDLLQTAILQDIEAGEDASARRRMRTKQVAETSLYRALADLGLMPRRKQGRPPTERPEEPEDDDDQRAWDAFGLDEEPGDGADDR